MRNEYNVRVGSEAGYRNAAEAVSATNSTGAPFDLTGVKAMDETTIREQVANPAIEPLAFLSGGGEMGERTRGFDWSKTSLGPPAGWPQSLKIALRILLDSRYAMWVGWGPELIFFYNDSYARMTLGPKHPWALGRAARDVWSEAWDELGPRSQLVMHGGRATWDEGLMLFLERRGFKEETYHTFSYSPIPDEQGGIGGMLCVVTEDTERTIADRRLRTLRALAVRTADEAKSAEEACQAAARTLAENPQDLPFVLIYLLDEHGETARLVGATGLAGFPAAAASAPVAKESEQQAVWPPRAALVSGQMVVVTDFERRFGPLRCGPWPEPTHQAVIVPIDNPGQNQPAGFVVSGVSPRLAFDDAYKGFLELLARHIATAISNARAYEQERRRVEVLAELDRAKTAFFSNVSHEFRTPLTLMLGPIQDVLAKAAERVLPENRELMEVANRNGTRLLRLVNTLLDFSRIEAGRVQASYEPTDLAVFSAELASNFRSACERAGVKLIVDCEPLSEPTYVDQQMWEKIVLNLLSNAFKFTFQGEIGVQLRQRGESVELQVSDTGTGIPAEELPRLFERFHRIENAQGRTHEGSGIGLSLVYELVKLHGGSISAESAVGLGTTFTVSIPLGSSHLPASRLAPGSGLASTSSGPNPFVEEALRWLPGPDHAGAGNQDEAPLHYKSFSSRDDGAAAAEGDDRPRVLVADDNLDMRQYVTRLLSDRYCVQAVADGAAALAAARMQPPDLVLTDVMMPRLDGFGLLRELRADPRTRGLPVVMLSARAGEESRVEGAEAGADDYLVKPFGARELRARVSSQLQMARLRREANESLRQNEERLRMALTAAQMVAWQVDLNTGKVVFSDNAADVFKLPPGSTLESIAQVRAPIHPEDAERHRAIVAQAVEKRVEYLSEYRIVRPGDRQVRRAKSADTKLATRQARPSWLPAS